MTDITDWPVYRAMRIAEWSKSVCEIDALLEKKGNIERLIEERDALIDKIEQYQMQQEAEGH